MAKQPPLKMLAYADEKTGRSERRVPRGTDGQMEGQGGPFGLRMAAGQGGAGPGARAGGRAGSAKSLLMFPPQLGLPAAGDGNLRVMAATSSPQTAGGRCNDRRGFHYSEADHTQ